MIKGTNLGYDLSQGFDGDEHDPTKVLAVGEPDDWTTKGNALPSGQVAFLAFNEITRDLLDHMRPQVIYSPVLARSFDCVDLALLLHEFRYDGLYCACGNGLPKPDLIVREIRQMCPGLKFEYSDLAD